MRTPVIALASLLIASCHAAPSDHDAGQGSLLTDAPPTGDVAGIVRDALAKAQAARRTLVVYVGARWCEPCQGFHEAAARGELDAPLGGATFLVFDLDRDHDRLKEAGYVSKYIPLFALPGSDGRSSGAQVEGGIKGDGGVAYLTPRIQELLAAVKNSGGPGASNRP